MSTRYVVLGVVGVMFVLAVTAHLTRRKRLPPFLRVLLWIPVYVIRAPLLLAYLIFTPSPSDSEMAARLERMGVMPAEEWLEVNRIGTSYSAQPGRRMSNEDFEALLFYLRRGALDKEDIYAYALHFHEVAREIGAAPLSEAQKDQLLPLIREFFNGRDTPEGYFIKFVALSLMEDVKESRFVPDALTCLEHPSRNIRRMARQYLKVVGYLV